MASASSAASPSAGTNAGPSVAGNHFRILDDPDFLARMDEFRKHFGTEPKLRTVDGLSFLDRDKASLAVGSDAGNGGNDQPQADIEATTAGNGGSASQAPSSLQAAAQGAAANMHKMRPPSLAVIPEIAAGNGNSTSQTPSNVQTAAHGAAAEMRKMRQPPLPEASASASATAAMAAKPAKAANLVFGGDGLHGAQNQGESTLDNLLGVIRSSTGPRIGDGLEDSPAKSAAAAAPVGTVQPASGGAGGGDLMRSLGKRVERQAQGVAVGLVQIAKISVQIRSMVPLTDLRSMINKSKERAARRRRLADASQNGVQTAQKAPVRQLDGAGADATGLVARGVARGARSPREDASTKTETAVLGKAAPDVGKDDDDQADASRDTKRPMPAEFIFQVQVPQPVRRKVADVIITAQVEKRKRRREPESEAQGGTSTDAESGGGVAAKRARTSAAQDRADKPRARGSSRPAGRRDDSGPRSRSRSRSRSHSRSRNDDRSRGRSRGSRRRDSSADNSDGSGAGRRSQAASPARPRSPSVARAYRAQADVPVETPEHVSAQGQAQPVAAAAAAAAAAPAMAGRRACRDIAWLTEGEIKNLRRTSSRLDESMRSFKRIGDAERESKSTPALEIVSYLETMACCMEDYWIRGTFNSAADMHKLWGSMMGFCKYLETACEMHEFALLRGCAVLVSACVNYQLATLELEQALAHQDGDAAGVQRLVAEAARRLERVEQMQQTANGLLGARSMARHLPQVWRRCQESDPQWGTYELRSTPHTASWPAVAYPVDAMSNPLDVANFVRQAGREWLRLAGLTLRMPARQG